MSGLHRPSPLFPALRLAAAVLGFALLRPATGLAAGATAPNGMVATDHELASRAGVEMLRAGGNAMDAALAAGYVLGVVNPQSSGLGGGGFALYHDAATGCVYALEFRDRAPVLAAIAPGRRGKPQPPAFLGASAAIPAEVLGFEAARERFSRLCREDLLRPAIRLCREGFRVGRLMAGMTRNYLKKTKSRNAELDALVTRPDGTAVQEGDLLLRPDLARTLERIAAEGARAVTHGEIARDVARAVNDSGGLMTPQELAAIGAHWVEPLHLEYRGHDVYAMPPPSSGAAVLMALRLFEPTPAPRLGAYSPTAVAALADALQRSTRAKRLYLGDPAFSDIPLDYFLKGGPEPGASSDSASGDEEDEGEEHTTHISAADRWGNAVSMTLSLGASYGSHILVKGTGILLSNHAGDFSPAPHQPNCYGTRYGPANVLEPLKAPVSGQTPMLVTRDGRFRLAVGGSGAARIPPAVTQALVKILDQGYSPGDAVASPRFQVNTVNRKVKLEEEFPRPARRALELMGFPVREGVKRASVTAVDRLGDLYRGGSDPRKYGVPLGH